MRFILVLITLLLQIFYSGNEVYAFLPAARSGHNAVLIKDRLYCDGGSFTFSSYNFFYLDVSKSFNLINTSSMHWTDLSFVTSYSPTNGASVNNNSIYYFSGDDLLSRVDKFDTLTEQWVTFNFSGINTTLANIFVSYVQGVISKNIIYYFNPYNESTMIMLDISSGYSQGLITTLNIKTFVWANLTALNDGFIPGQKDNYKWVNSYEIYNEIQNGNQSPSSTPSYITTPNETFGIVGGVIGIISGLMGLILVSCICYTYRKNNLHVNHNNGPVADHYPVSMMP
ncbi:1938_t:CDS:2 [Cetraspora pellucida]|uniref:1938_t:CDS:1 n=1 Tax=Cetraspora pellucida TaxID=1433469 RepID=A0A9N9JKZ9_9GLOM|nr:1938_t:CDS:2 [Cetraspora pellucida]